jgi:hypothetical protein
VVIALLWIFSPKPQSSRTTDEVEEFSEKAVEEVEVVINETHVSEPASSALVEPTGPETEEVTEVIPPAELVNLGPTAPTSYQRNLTIATMMKNQRCWLREWIEFYSMMGAQHFLIYDNNSTDHPEEVLQYYIDIGRVTHITWPPKDVPPPPPEFASDLEEWQYSWFNDTLQTCLLDSWTVHRQVPCQLAAFSDAISRTKDGQSRWIGIFDVDEYIYPRPASAYRNLVELLQGEYKEFDHVRIFGNTFGTSGHLDHAAQREPGNPLHALLTQFYVYRAPQDGNGVDLRD